MTDQGLQPEIKVWQPKGFEGVEIELLEHLPALHRDYLMFSYEITALRGGFGRVRYRNEVIEARGAWSQPFLYIQSPDERVVAELPSGGSIWTLRLSQQWVQRILEDSSWSSTSLPAFLQGSHENLELNQFLANATCRAVEVFHQPASQLERQTLLLKVFMATLQQCGDFRVAEQHAGKEPEAVQRTKQYLQEHFTYEVSLDDLAGLAKLNKYYLLETFKKKVGVSPHVYQTSLRIQRAKKSLAKGLAIADVAIETGFADQAHLTRVFKQYVQVTPGQFQKDSLKG